MWILKCYFRGLGFEFHVEGFRRVEANCILLGPKDLLVAVWGCIFKSVRVG